VTAHGLSIPPLPGTSLRVPKARQLRNLSLEAGQEQELYQGLPSSDDTRAMLRKLATFMRSTGNPEDDDNTALPAGYTYLAQFVAHDLVHNALPLPGASLERPDATRDDLRRDYRTNRLVLDTIYGGGPSINPLSYVMKTHPPRRGFKLRLGEVREREADCAAFKPGVCLDIPRARCPHLNDAPGDSGAADALLADPRNDDNLILSQLARLFHELHNCVVDRLPSRDGRINLNEQLAFLEARRIVAYVYRRILRKDLMPRLIEPGVLDYYSDLKRIFPKDFIFDRSHDDSNRVPVEFSHAAFRFGHILVRPFYDLNKDLNPQPLGEVLYRSSSRAPRLLPLGANWLIDWSRFFELEGKSGGRFNSARKIRPYTANIPLLAGGEDGELKGGLLYFDLVRGAEAGIRSVASLIEDIPPPLVEFYPLRSPDERARKIRAWLAGGSFTDAEIESLSTDPPLAFYVLFEAEATQNSERLGVLGSAIIAEVIVAALTQGEEVIEKSVEDATLVEIFGASVPESMPALIEFIHAQRKSGITVGG
jgi:hypothetical protein